MATTYNAVTITTAATILIPANPGRRGIMVVNNSTSTIYIGPDSAITTANAIPLYASGTFITSGDHDGFRGVIYGIVGASTADVRYWEWTA